MSNTLVNGTLPNGLVPFGPDANCTLATCSVESSLLGYRPSVLANGIFIGVFGALMAAHIAQGCKYGTWGFLASIVCGCILEIVGYIGRLMVHHNPFDFSGFLMQIICITVAPIFFCSAIYVLLHQVIKFIDPSISRVKPRFISIFFIIVDIISLILQALGGALSVVSTAQEDIDVGVDISLAGLIFQVVTLIGFAALFADYIISCRRKLQSFQEIRHTMGFFLLSLFICIILILLRCAYRIAELQEGYFSELFREQYLFIALESGVMCLAVGCLNLGHPGPVLGRKLHKMASEIELTGDTN